MNWNFSDVPPSCSPDLAIKLRKPPNSQKESKSGNATDYPQKYKTAKDVRRAMVRRDRQKAKRLSKRMHTSSAVMFPMRLLAPD